METTSVYDKKRWLSQYENGVPHEIAFERSLLPDFLERSAALFPEKSALNFEGCRVTFKELNSMVENFSAHLYAFGVRKGDAVAILLPNLISCVVSYYAIIKIGGIVVMNNPQSPTYFRTDGSYHVYQYPEASPHGKSRHDLHKGVFFGQRPNPG